MTEYCWNSQATSGMSNEDSAVLTFQRTISAQVVNIMLVLLFDSRGGFSGSSYPMKI